MKPEVVLSAFVLRARRVLAHSLVREHRSELTDYAAGKHTILLSVSPDGTATPRMKESDTSDEELFESLASRIRPITLGSEAVSYRSVMKALRAAVSPEQLSVVSDMTHDEWEARWEAVAARDGEHQGFKMITEEGELTDREIAFGWFYCDVAHADDAKVKTPGVDLANRFLAARALFSRIVFVIELTYYLILQLAEEGFIELDPVAVESVVTATDAPRPESFKVYFGPVGTEMPADLDDLPEGLTELSTVEALQHLRGGHLDAERRSIARIEDDPSN